MLKICNVRPAKKDESHFKIFHMKKRHISQFNTMVLPFKAMTLDFGFIIAESAEIGRRIGLFALSMSIMTTCAVSPIFSRTQINLSDSMVRVEKPMFAALMPIF